MYSSPHISYKKSELPLLQRERELSKVLNKNRSDTYKYCLNRTYLQVMTRKEEGQMKQLEHEENGELKCIS
tara:strand:+ start:313 stop:525 length:213 start_codon:yes stop_codon:yes gene_type:complete